MTRINESFKVAKSENRAALVVFITAGDPDLATTRELVPALFAAGADVVELGMPHSDPIAEGPVIQASSARALASETNIEKILALVKDLRAGGCEGALVLMGYLNPVRAFGERAFAAECGASGVDGVIIADAPYEAAGDLHRQCQESGVDSILLITPTSSTERIVRLAAASRGFVYCVSTTGVTGERQSVSGDVTQLVKRIRRVTDTPVAVGFGISNARHAADVARYADGVIVGSAVVRRMADCGSPAESILRVQNFVGELREAVNRSA